MPSRLNHINIKYSIINNNQEEVKYDRVNPFSYLEYLKYGEFDLSNKISLINSYNGYISEWNSVRGSLPESDESQRRNLYRQLLKEIELNYTNDDERRYLSQYNIDDPLELDVVIPFYVEKIKEITIYFLRKRYELADIQFDWLSRGSLRYLENNIKRYIFSNFTKSDSAFESYRKGYVELGEFQRGYSLDYESLYDLNNYREDIYGGIKDFNKLEGIYSKYVTEDITITVDGGIFKDIISKSKEYDINNLYTPYIMLSSNTDNLIGEAELGDFIKPEFIRASVYFTPNGVGGDNDNGVNINPSYYSNGGKFIDYPVWVKNSTINQAQSGKPIESRELRRFYGYVSREELLGDSTVGVSRYTDKITNWVGTKAEKWANSDVFEEYKENILNREDKNEVFFNLRDNEGVVKYISDIYNNEYYLIKPIKINKHTDKKVYPLKQFGAVDMIAMGQSSESYDYNMVGILDDVGVGMYPETAPEMFDDSKTYNVDVGYFQLGDGRYNSKLSETYPDLVHTDNDPELTSIYEREYRSGRVLIRVSGGGKFIGLDGLLSEDELGGANINEILDIEILSNVMVIRTSNKILFVRVGFDYKASKIRLDTYFRNYFDNVVEVAKKTGDIWFDGKNSIYFSEVEVDGTLVKPIIRRLSVDVMMVDKVYEVSSEDLHNFTLPDIISIDSISRPSIAKHGSRDRFLLTTMIKDIYKNYLYLLSIFEEGVGGKLKFISNKLISPHMLTISSGVGAKFPHSSEINDYLNDGYRVYYNVNDNKIEHKSTPTYKVEEIKTYNIDRGEEIVDKPLLVYKLSDFPDIEPTTRLDHNGFNVYSYDIGEIYGPCEFEFDILELNKFTDIITPNTHIFSILYNIDGINFSRGVSANNTRDYNKEFFKSPINQSDIKQKFVVGNDGEDKEVIFRLVELDGTFHTFEVKFRIHSIDINDKFTDINLLDSRYFSNGGKDFVKLYLNTRNPDYVTGVKFSL